MPVGIIRKINTGTYDEFNNPITVSNEEDPIIVEGILAFRNSSTQVKPEEVSLNTEIKLILDEGTVVFDDDVFLINGTKWQKDGTAFSPDQNLIINNGFLPAPIIVNISQVKGKVS